MGPPSCPAGRAPGAQLPDNGWANPSLPSIWWEPRSISVEINLNRHADTQLDPDGRPARAAASRYFASRTPPASAPAPWPALSNDSAASEDRETSPGSGYITILDIIHR